MRRKKTTWLYYQHQYFQGCIFAQNFTKLLQIADVISMQTILAVLKKSKNAIIAKMTPTLALSNEGPCPVPKDGLRCMPCHNQKDRNQLNCDVKFIIREKKPGKNKTQLTLMKWFDWHSHQGTRPVALTA